MIITISGKAGSGKSSIAAEIAKRLGYQYIDIGGMRREVAEQMGLNIIDFNELGEKPENKEAFDIKYEEYQKSLDLNSNILLDARLGFYCQPKSFKIFLDVSDEVAAKRIFENNRSTDKYSSLEDVLLKTEERNKEDVDRWLALYGVNFMDHKNYDIVFDTSNNTLEENVNQLTDIIKKKLSGGSSK